MRYASRIRKGLALVVGAYLALMFFRNGVIKFDAEGFWTAPFERWGYPVWLRIVVGAIEAVGGALLVVPWLATWAGLAVGGVMVGAGVTRAIDGNWVDVSWIALYMAASLWIAWEWRAWRVPRRTETPAA
ncbi:MAG: DoxX family protein [Longimicrobiales bacterium]